jgi:transcriptional regulator with XRE-family HTH domain
MNEKLRSFRGEVARAARERLGLTQDEVAHEVDLVPSVYGYIERGNLVPSVPSLRRLCLVLGISSDALLGVCPPRVAATVEGARSEEAPCQEFEHITQQLRTWSPKRLRMLGKILRAFSPRARG